MNFLKRRLEASAARKADKAEIEALMREALEDDILTEAEEEHLLEVVGSKGWDTEQLSGTFPELYLRLGIAQINDGRLPIIEDPSVMTKGDEVVYFEGPARLAKEVAVREWRGGGSGVSIPIGGGMRFRTGQTRGRSVVVGSELAEADAGLFAVTSTRAVFQGSRKSLEFAFPKMIGMDLYADGIRLAVSNRQNPSLFWISPAEGVAAVITGAMKKAESAPAPARKTAASSKSAMAQLKQLGELHEAGVLTSEEFETKKRELLERV